MTADEKRKEITSYYLPEAGRLLAERIKEEVPVSGYFQNMSFSFELDETNNMGMLLYEFDSLHKGEQRILNIGLRRIDSSYMVKRCIFNGTNDEIIKFLNFSEENLNKFADCILEMSDRADERDERFFEQ